jgi:hypothetical protein
MPLEVAPNATCLMWWLVIYVKIFSISSAHGSGQAFPAERKIWLIRPRLPVISQIISITLGSYPQVRCVDVAISEKICWEVLRSCKENNVSFTSDDAADGSSTEPIKYALPLYAIERDLVLRHEKQQIEDSLFFLEKRGYLIKHGYTGFTLVAIQLSASALEVLKSGVFPPEEQHAFRESLMELEKPGIWGMKVNLAEAWRRFQKWRKQ